jgi:hypothetical protein
MVVAIPLIAALMFGSAPAEGQKKKPAPPKVVTLKGCVERDQTAPDQYTVTDTNEGVKYRVTGKDFREYLGRSVQVDGGVVVKGIVIKGGLQPTANIAAQAGALDPSRAVVEAQTTGTATGATNNLQEFRVKTIRTTGGSCK